MQAFVSETSNPTHKFHHQFICAMFLYILFSSPTCFGHLQGVTGLVDVYSVNGNLSQINGTLYII